MRRSRTSSAMIAGAVLALAPQMILAQEDAAAVPATLPATAEDAAVPATMPAMPTTCSCSPTVFSFTILLDGSCDKNDIAENPGIDGSFCFVEEGVALPAPQGTAELEEAEAAMPEMCSFCPDGLLDPDFMLPTDAGTTCGQAAELAATLTPEDENCATVQLAEQLCCVAEEEAPVPATLPATEADAATTEPVRRRRLQDETTGEEEVEVTTEVTAEVTTTEEPVPENPIEVDPNAVVEIVSVQFLEFDTSGDLTVINQDDTYADVSLNDGDRLKFYSASSFLDTSLPLEDQMSNPALVPGGASVILYGKTAGGEIVRNRFFWIYDMNCGRENSPVNTGDKIGWVRVNSAGAGAWPTFCPAQPDNPTIAPRSNEPTLTPTVSPTGKPSMSPAMSMRTVAPTTAGSKITPHPTHGSDGSPAFSKSGKGPKTHKPSAKSTKATKSSKSSKSTKATKHSSSSSSGDMMGKTGKELPEGYSTYPNMERLSEVDVSQLNAASSSSSYGMGLLLMSLVASMLITRH